MYLDIGPDVPGRDKTCIEVSLEELCVVVVDWELTGDRNEWKKKMFCDDCISCGKIIIVTDFHLEPVFRFVYTTKFQGVKIRTYIDSVLSLLLSCLRVKQ